MAHFVAKELHLRPYTILTEWTVEELMVAFGEYANIHSKESYEMTPAKERAKKRMTWADQWAVKFVPLEDALKMQDGEDVDKVRQNELALQDAASMFF